MKKLTKIALLWIVSFPAFSAGWYEVGNVTRVHTGHDDGVMYFSTETQRSVSVCTNNVNGYTFSDSEGNSERIYSLLLTAYISKNPVTVFLNDTCLNGRPTTTAVQFKDSGVAP